MRACLTAAFILLLGLSFPAAVHALEPPSASVSVDPPFADRLFPYIAYDEVWGSTPARSSETAVPNAAIVYGAEADPKLVARAGTIGIHLGTWVQAVRLDPEDARTGRFPSLILSDREFLAEQSKWDAAIVVGTDNEIARRAGVSFEQPGIRAVEQEGRKYLFAAGSTLQETLRAADHLAHVRIRFKAGAYRTFFNFVRLRGLIEKENWEAARLTIRSPEGLSACGRNMALAAHRLQRAPDEVQALVRRRNELLYSRIGSALNDRDRTSAARLWSEAMATCYACHQGAEGFPVLRRFKPLESIHAKHQRIAARFELPRGCSACHSGKTAIRGYD